MTIPEGSAVIVIAIVGFIASGASGMFAIFRWAGFIQWPLWVILSPVWGMAAVIFLWFIVNLVVFLVKER